MAKRKRADLPMSSKTNAADLAVKWLNTQSTKPGIKLSEMELSLAALLDAYAAERVREALEGCAKHFEVSNNPAAANSHIAKCVRFYAGQLEQKP